MSKLLGKDESGNYAMLDDDGKIGVYNADGKLVTMKDAEAFMAKLGRPSKHIKGKLYSGLTRGEVFGEIGGINLGGFA